MSKPVCPHEPATGSCPGIEDPNHKAMFLHRCPYGHPCPKSLIPAHCADFYHSSSKGTPTAAAPVAVPTQPGGYYHPTASTAASSGSQPEQQLPGRIPQPGGGGGVYQIPLQQQQHQQFLVQQQPLVPAPSQHQHQVHPQQAYMTIPVPQPGHQVIVSAPQQQQQQRMNGMVVDQQQQQQHFAAGGGVSPYGPPPVQLPASVRPVPYGYSPINAVMSTGIIAAAGLTHQQLFPQQQHPSFPSGGVPLSQQQHHHRPQTAAAPEKTPLPFPSLTKQPPPK